MKTELEICIGESGILVGTLHYEASSTREYSCFQYDQSWLESPHSFALAPSLKLQENKIFFSGEHPLPAPLMDTLPDSWGKNMLIQHARIMSLNATLNPHYLLISVFDLYRSGALRIRHQNNEFLAQDNKEIIPHLTNLNDFRKLVRSLEEKTPETEALRRFIFAGSSLGGARPKCSVLDDENYLCIAKFTSSNDTKSVVKAEVMTLRLARLCGILTPEVKLFTDIPELPIAIIRRFDRGGGKRIPFISAQTMLDSSTAENRTYTELADEIRSNGFDPKADLKELFKRILFTIFVSNTDDHLKNHGFLYTGNNKWKLSPIFDVNPFPDRIKTLKTKIADGTDNSASVGLLIENAFYFEIEEDEAIHMATSMAQIITDHWKRLSKEVGMSDADIEDYRPAFEHPEIRGCFTK
jgi:serine/threonine-protein kinase HipA